MYKRQAIAFKFANTTRNKQIYGEVSDIILVEDDTLVRVEFSNDIPTADLIEGDVLQLGLPQVIGSSNFTYNNKKAGLIKHPDNTGSGLEQYDFITAYAHSNTLIVNFAQYLGGDQSDISNLDLLQWQDITPIT